MINAALVSMTGSFNSQYWQNSTIDYWHSTFGKGDDRGRIQETGGIGGEIQHLTTGSTDVRGSAIFYGSLALNKQTGLFRRRPGPYDLAPGIGYVSEFHYDDNLYDSPPPGFERLTNPLNTSSIDNKSAITPEFLLHQNFPNPFNSSTTIMYDIFDSGNTSLIVYDITGRVMQTLLLKSESPGSYQVTWDGRKIDGTHVSGGVYFARLLMGEYSSVVKMILLK